MSINRHYAVQEQIPEGDEPRKQSGLRRALGASDAADLGPAEAIPLPPPLPHIPGLPTPAELQIAAQQRLTPLAPKVLVRSRHATLPPRLFLPPQSVRRAFISQMQADAPPRPARVWPWLVVAFILASAGVTFGLFGLGIVSFRF